MCTARIGADGTRSYTVRSTEDDHESLFFPGPKTHVEKRSGTSRRHGREPSPAPTGAGAHHRAGSRALPNHHSPPREAPAGARARRHPVRGFPAARAGRRAGRRTGSTGSAAWPRWLRETARGRLDRALAR
ncbi:DUF1918 domain-containing protein [Embleya sp. NPDC050493]|uniref:DUF1918 domain-containing protein n=1 Tax=Embleya sp. NPDC050493 TaxID=3363989 RepID=UPI0037A6EDFF